MDAVLIVTYSSRFRNEKEYCFHVLFRELLGLDFRVVFSEEVKNYSLQLPNGTAVVVEDHFFSRLPASNLPGLKDLEGFEALLPSDLAATNIKNPFLPGGELTCIYGQPEFSIEDQRITCGLDVFASTFFMLTRWEEFVVKDRDRHGRFPAEKSLAFKAGFLYRPVVNEFAELLWQMFARLGWSPPRPERQFNLTITCDVDHPRLWWSPGDRFKTLAGSIFKRGDLKEAGFWLKNHFFQQKDPYDVFDEWLDLFEKNGCVAQFNFFGKRPPSSDCWYPLEHPFVKNLIEKIAGRGHRIGFHPSYESFEDQMIPDQLPVNHSPVNQSPIQPVTIFERELASLRAVSPAPVTVGRQHYLRFAAPYTWQVWENAGMTSDCTLGYPEAEGFRCGICRDFPVFNFLTRKMLNLREKPLLAMDATLALYRKYSPETAFERLQDLRRQVEKHGGEFVILWHNSSWNTYFWARWKEVFRAFITR